MIESKLFLGFSVDADFAKALQAVNPKKVSFFLQGNEHLQEIVFLGERYVGKHVGETVDFTSLELLEANVYSVLKMLTPTYDCEKISLRLFPILQE